MVFVIADGCCNDASCVEVCPVDCIRPRPEDPQFRTTDQLYIDPASCIGCAACAYACPVSAIHDETDLPAHLSDFAARNRDHFVEEPLTPRFLEAPASPTASRATDRGTTALRIAVIGSGPAGCYTVAELTDIPGIEVTVLDRLITPFGLLRAGVAPDHPRTKLVSDFFDTVLSRPQVTCLFDVEVGVDVAIDEVLASHHAVVYAGGATDDRRLGIDGESLSGSHPAREFVAWYNGHPDFAHHTFDLNGHTAVVLGNGNVALDVARILSSTPDTLARTDIADHALHALRRSQVREVVVVGRRGPGDAACTWPELSELGRLEKVDVRVPPTDLEIGLDAVQTGTQLRKAELLRHLATTEATGERQITFRFGLQAVEMTGENAVEQLRLRSTREPDRELETIDTSLVLRAVGYAVAPVPGLPFDPVRHTIANLGGRVQVHETGDTIAGLYCAGWAKRGPSGVIGTNKVCAQETVAALLEDAAAGRLNPPTASVETLLDVLRQRRTEPVGMVGWRSVDRHEREAGGRGVPPRPRRKLVDRDVMRRTAAGQGPS
ncbi:4Fe-4S dicluster domain-containing protein [Nocardioides alkalitolerans]|uniref:4Fe-4S dicluster domain-containing protein n=1 Tax=Nocardioides alkalitolerans TaxID=281714 RepID=UPI0004031133|nr:4Fe-4S binding protein [Nocardioides alkalitolerans]